MHLGVHLIDFPSDTPGGLGPAVAAAAIAAERAGAATFTLADHFFHMETVAPVDTPFLEGYTTLGYLAARTETIALGLAVTGVTYRNPGVLAKTVATLDALSGGRAILGLGAAWHEREHLGLGVPFPPLARRFEMLEETLQICEQMFGDDDGPYRGNHYQLAETICQPRPDRHVPVLIGGDGEKKTLRMVARYADMWNSTRRTPEEFAAKDEVLREHCARIGRDPGAIARSVMVGPGVDFFGAEFLDTAAGFASVGVDTIIVPVLPGADDPVAFIDRLGTDVVPRLAELEPRVSR